MKLSDLEPKTLEVKLTHPVAGELPASLLIKGPDSAEFSEAYIAIYKARLEEGIEKVPVDRLLSEERALMAAVVVGWTNDDFWEGPFSKERIMKIMENPEYYFLYDNVKKAFSDRTLFFNALPKA